MWVDIPGFTNLYKINPEGQVYSLYIKRILKPRKDISGHLYLVLKKDTVSRKYSVHQLMAKTFLPDYSEDLVIDHIDRDPQNNNLSNLRMVSHHQNLLNRSPQGNNVLGLKGVSRATDRNMFLVQIRNNKKYYIKRFHSLIDAVKFYNEKSQELHGEFGYINDIPKDDIVLDGKRKFYKCICGKEFYSGNQYRHNRTKFHNAFMEKQNTN